MKEISKLVLLSLLSGLGTNENKNHYCTELLFLLQAAELSDPCNISPIHNSRQLLVLQHMNSKHSWTNLISFLHELSLRDQDTVHLPGCHIPSVLAQKTQFVTDTLFSYDLLSDYRCNFVPT